MGILSKLAGLFTGGAVETIKAGADIVERWAPGVEKKAELAAEIDAQIEHSVNNARSADTKIGMVPGFFNDVVNGVNRLIRPGVTIGLVGGIMGFWHLPATGEVDPVILGWTEIVLIFWFGGRALFKDLPSLLSYVKATRR